MKGTESTEEIDGDSALLNRLEAVRGAAALKLGFVSDPKAAAWESPGVPKLTIVSAPSAYTAGDGSTIGPDEIDLVSRMMSMQKAHPSYAMTGAMCTVAAAAIPGTVVNSVLTGKPDWSRFRIGHPGGILPAGIVFRKTEKSVVIEEAFGFRTANLLMDGFAYYNCHTEK